LIPVHRSTRPLFAEGKKSGLEGDMVYLIDIDKHKSCYALLEDTNSSQPHQQIGWAVFDEGDLVEGPFVAARISTNNAENDRRSMSANVLILKVLQNQLGHYERVGMGEIVASNWLDIGAWTSTRIY
jgi:hypothetical protein